MFAKIRKLFQRPRKIAFLDGDQSLNSILCAYGMYLANTGTEVHLVRMRDGTQGEPKILRNIDTNINKIYLTGFSTGKEIVDKFIAAYVQRAVSEKYDEITVVSSDYDFIDIFKMAVQVNPIAGNVKFRMIVPLPQGRLVDLPQQILNIEVIKC